MTAITAIAERFVRIYIQPYMTKPLRELSDAEIQDLLLVKQLKDMPEDEKTLAALILDLHVTEAEKAAEKAVQDAIDARDAYHWWLEKAGQ